jgi:hypothetical protein
MMTHPINYKRVLAAVRTGHFTDTGHYYCPEILADGTIRFSLYSGVVRPDNTFVGPARLLEAIQQLLPAAFESDGVSDGEWACYWESPLGCGSHLVSRHSSREEAERAVAAHDDFPGLGGPNQYLCGYGVRVLFHGRWLPPASWDQ